MADARLLHTRCICVGNLSHAQEELLVFILGTAPSQDWGVIFSLGLFNIQKLARITNTLNAIEKSQENFGK